MAAPGQGSALAGRLAELLAPAVTGADLVLEEVTVQPAGKRRLVRVVVDLPDGRTGGIPLDSVAAASQAVSAVLDETDAMGQQPYVLEVTSPGVDRPLTQPRHFRRNLGRLVEVTLAEGAPVTGRITSAGDDVLVLDVEGSPRELAWDDVTSARVQVEFNRPDGVDTNDDADDADDETDESDDDVVDEED